MQKSPTNNPTNRLSQYVFYPETKGLALEDVDHLFAKNEETRRELSVSQTHGDDQGGVYSGPDEIVQNKASMRET